VVAGNCPRRDGASQPLCHRDQAPTRDGAV